MYQVWLAALLLGITFGTCLFWAFRPRQRTIHLLICSFVVGLAIFGIGFPTYAFAHDQVKAQAVGGFSQNINSWSESTNVVPIQCTKEKVEYGGSTCRHTEHCDPYTVWVTKTYTDSKGKTQTKQEPETRWYDCPLVSRECSYTVTDRMKHVYDFGHNLACADAQTLRGSGRALVRGDPTKWKAIDSARQAGIATAMTYQETYENYILGSEQADRRKWAKYIDRMKAAHLLQPHMRNLTDPIYNVSDADRMVFIGMGPPANNAQLQASLASFDSQLGMTLQGDMHVAVFKASALAKAGLNPETAFGALRAHWLYDLGKRALGKNGLMLVLAVNDAGNTIEWARSGIGMPPKKNGEMIDALNRRLSGHDVAFDPITLFGTITAQYTTVDGKQTLSYINSGGIVRQVVLVDHKFIRLCMKCKDKDEKGQQGYLRLKDLIPISGKAIFLSILSDLGIALVIALGTMLAYSRLGGYPTRFSLNDHPIGLRHASSY